LAKTSIDELIKAVQSVKGVQAAIARQEISIAAIAKRLDLIEARRVRRGKAAKSP
jgi:hypothetical protein